MKFLLVIYKTCSTFKDTRGPSGLHLSDGHGGSKWLHQTNDSQGRTVQARGEHILVERRFVLRHWDHVSVQERKRERVARGEHLWDWGVIWVQHHWPDLCSEGRCVSMNSLPPSRHPPPHSHHQTPRWSRKTCGCWASPEPFQRGCGWEVHRWPWDVG